MIISKRMLSSFHPTLPLVVFATKAKLFDPTFSSESELLLYDYSKEYFYPKINLEHRCNRIEWCNNYIVVGMENGKISVFECSINTELEKEDIKNNFYILKEMYSNDNLLTGDILGISYNSNKNMIAIGSNNIILLSTEQLDKPYNSGIKTEFHGITYIHWNPKINHIMVVGTHKGVVILDLKKKKEIPNVGKDEFNRKIVQVEFHPFKNTSLLICTDNFLYSYDLGNDKLDVLYSVENIFNFNVINKNIILGAKNKLVLLDILEEKVLGEMDFDGIFDCKVSLRDSLLSISYLESGTKLLSLNSIFNVRRKNYNFFVLNKNKIITKNNIFRLKLYVPEIKESFEDKNAEDLLKDITNFKKLEFEQKEERSFNMNDNLIKAIFSKDKDKMLLEAKKETVEIRLSYFIEEEKIDNFKVIILEAIKNNDYKEMVEKVSVGDWYLAVLLIINYNSDGKEKCLNDGILECLSILASRLFSAGMFRESKYAYLLAKNYKEYFNLRSKEYKFNLFRYNKFIKEFTGLMGEYFILKEITDIEENKYIKEYFRYANMVGLKLKEDKNLEKKLEAVKIVEPKKEIKKIETKPVEVRKNILEPRKSIKENIQENKIRSTPPLKKPVERKLIPVPKKSPEIKKIEKTEEIVEENKPRTYGSIKGKSMVRPTKDILPPKKEIAPPTLKVPQPNKKEIKEEVRENDNTLEEKYNVIKEKIDFLCDKSKDIKKLVFKGRIKDSIKRIEYFYGKEKESIKDKKYLEDILNIISFDIKDIKEKIESKDKEYRDKIISEMKKKLEYYEEDVHDEKIWLPGVINLLSLVLSE